MPLPWIDGCLAASGFLYDLGIMKRTYAGFGCLAVTAWLGVAIAVENCDDPRIASVLAADDARIAAMTAADPVALAPLLSPDLRYSHSNGSVDSKESFLKLIGAKATRYVAYRPVERGVRFANPEIALMHGRADVVLEKDGRSIETTFVFLAVWRLEEGSWRFLEWQSSRPPAEGQAIRMESGP
jgi:hypothetical protein